MKILKIVLLFLLNLVIELSILSRFSIGNYTPAITIPLLILLAIFEDRDYVYYYAILQGLFQDAAFTGLLGIKALIFYLVVYYVRNSNYRKSTSLTYSFVSLFLSMTIIFIGYQIVHLLNNGISLSYHFNQIISTYIPGLVFTSISLGILFLIFHQNRKMKIKNFI